MAVFRYYVIDGNGRESSGTKEMSSKKELISYLMAEGYRPIRIEEAGGINTSSISKAFAKSTAKKGAKGRVKLEDIAVFCRQLSTLVNAGVNILEATEDISEMTTSARLGHILKQVSDDLRGGIPLSDSLKKHKEFSKTLTSMVEVGEKSGKLAKVLADLADYLEGNVKLIRKVKAASTYPMIIGIFFTLVLIGLVVFLIPMFEEMFLSFGSELPLPTQILMNISRFVISNSLFIILGIVAFIFGFKMFKKTPKGKMIVHKAMFSIPIFGKIYIKIVLARFFQTLSTLVKSGVDIISSLEISINVADNVYIESILDQVKEKVLAGNPLGVEMAKLPIFPRMVTRMTTVGEKSGQLDAMFDKITDYYNDEVDTTVASLSSIVEPILIVGMGIIVGTAVVAMYLPIFNLAAAMMAGST